MNLTTQFRLPDALSMSEIDAILAEFGAIPAETPPAQCWRTYDTFDWRLHAGSLTLQWSGDQLLLRSVRSGKTLHCLPASSPPRFASDLPAGPFRDQLHAVTAPRALLDLATVHTFSRTFRALNNDQKTVARLLCTEARLDGGDEAQPAALFLTVLPLRGYAGSAARLADRLGRSLRIAPTADGVYLWALRAAGHTPGGYSNKLDVQLEPGMKAGKAVRLVLRRMLEMMRANEAGVMADIDSEFLHDYRVAVRRTRSTLTQIRGVFPKERVAAFRQQFRDWGRLTNDLRDLDVHLLAEADYRALLPDAMQEDISPLFEDLRARRADALAAVVSGLQSDAYTRLIAEYEAFLRKPAKDDDAPNTAVPIIDLVRARLSRQYRLIVKDGNYLLKHTEDELLHALRIECKKLRYMLECCASLFPPNEFSQVIGRLKMLQDNLGAFADSKVQRDYLLSVAETLPIEETRVRRALVATGFLVETTARMGRKAKARFADTFAQFASRANQQAFQRLVAGGRKSRR